VGDEHRLLAGSGRAVALVGVEEHLAVDLHDADAGDVRVQLHPPVDELAELVEPRGVEGLVGGADRPRRELGEVLGLAADLRPDLLRWR
jgi:hypothetical protein